MEQSKSKEQECAPSQSHLERLVSTDEVTINFDVIVNGNTHLFTAPIKKNKITQDNIVDFFYPIAKIVKNILKNEKVI
jgi:hypothetical protein